VKPSPGALRASRISIARVSCRWWLGSLGCWWLIDEENRAPGACAARCLRYLIRHFPWRHAVRAVQVYDLVALPLWGMRARPKRRKAGSAATTAAKTSTSKTTAKLLSRYSALSPRVTARTPDVNLYPVGQQIAQRVERQWHMQRRVFRASHLTRHDASSMTSVFPSIQPSSWRRLVALAGRRAAKMAIFVAIGHGG